MGTNDIDTAVNAHIANINTWTATAIADMGQFIPNLQEFVGTVAPFYTAGTVQYPGTESHFGDIVVPALEELGDATDAIDEAGSTRATIAGVDAEMASLLEDIKAKFDGAGSSDGPQDRLDALARRFAEFGGSGDDLIVVPTIDTFRFQETNYSPDVLGSPSEDTVKEKLITALSESAGGTTSTEDTYYSDYLRRMGQNAGDERSNTIDEFAGRGFTLDQETLQSISDNIALGQGYDRNTADDNITVQKELLFQTNRKNAVEASLRYNQALLAYYNEKMNRSLTIAKLIYKISMEFAALKFAILAALYDSQKIRLDAVTEGQRAVLEEFIVNTVAYGKKIESIIDEARSYSASYEANGSVVESMKRVANEYSAFEVSDKEITQKVRAFNLRLSLQSALDNLDTFITMKDDKADAVNTGMNMQLASAISARKVVDAILQNTSGTTYTNNM